MTGIILLQFIFEVLDEGIGAGLRIDRAFGGPVLGQGIREPLAPPF
ncbi:MAG: hypothetical protein LBQ88_05980 [Treponema sp.]|nr:hypothetical protein [Treponema sp.]